MGEFKVRESRSCPRFHALRGQLICHLNRRTPVKSCLAHLMGCGRLCGGTHHQPIAYLVVAASELSEHALVGAGGARGVEAGVFILYSRATKARGNAPRADQLTIVLGGSGMDVCRQSLPKK